MSRHWPLLLRLLTTSSPIFPPVLVHLDDLPPFAILSSGATNVHVMSLANVLDVLWDGSVSPNAMFVHQLNQFTLLKIVRSFCVLGDSVKVPDGNPCTLSQLTRVKSVLIQAHRPQLPRSHSHEAALSDLVIGVLEVVALHVDNHPSFQILEVIGQAGNEVPGDEVVYLPLIALADLFSGRCSHWSDGGVVAYISPSLWPINPSRLEKILSCSAPSRMVRLLHQNCMEVEGRRVG